MTARGASRAWWAAVLVLVLVTVGIRVLYASRQPDRIAGDGKAYHRLATQLVEEGYLGYGPDHHRSWRPPLYPAWVAGIYAVTGPRPFAAKVGDAGLAGLVVFLVALLGRRLGSPVAGLVGGALYAFHDYEIRHASDVYGEILAAVLVLAFVLLLVRPGGPRLREGLLAGLLAGTLLHLQPALIVVPALTSGWILLGRIGPRPFLTAVLLGVTTLLALVPWTIRNHAVHGQFVYVSTNGGFNLLKGNNPHADGDRLGPAGAAYIAETAAAVPDDLSEVERGGWFRDRALTWMRENPGRAAILPARRAWAWFVPGYLLQPDTKWPVTYGTIFPFALLGAFVLVRRRAGAGIPLVVFVAAAIPSVLVVYAGQRYRTPVLPIACLLGGFGIVWLVGRIRPYLPVAAPPPEAPPGGGVSVGSSDDSLGVRRVGTPLWIGTRT